MKKAATFLGLLFVAVCGVCFAQNPSEKTASKARIDVTYKEQLAEIKRMDRSLGATAEQIAEFKLAVMPVLAGDARVILAQREQVFADWKRAGYDEESQQKAEVYVWKDIRRDILKPNDPLTPEMWQRETARRGRIRISSEPQKADIHVDDGASAVDKSNNFVFPPAGPRKFCLKLQGYHDHCETREIRNGTDNVPIDAKLQEKK